MKEYKFLLTCEHSIPQEIIDSKTKIKIFYGRKIEEIKKKIILDSDQRFIKKIKGLDVTIIEIKEEDNIYENRFLHPDLNYKLGLDHYLNSQVYTAGYPNVQIHKGDKHYSTGIIKQVHNNGYTFFHTCDTKEGSSGGPIINYDKLVIGIHFGSIPEKKINIGSFIGEIINELFLEEKNINPLMEEDEKEKNNDENLAIEFIDKLINTQSFSNVMNNCFKGFDMEQFFVNIANNPQIQELNKALVINNPEFKDIDCTPVDIQKFKDKDNNIDYKALVKNNIEKLGCKDLNDAFSKYGNIALNSPLKNIVENELQNRKDKNDKNFEEIMKKNQDKLREDFINIFSEFENKKNNNNSKY